MPMFRVVCCVVGRVCWLRELFGKTPVSLCPISSWTPRANLAVTPGICSHPKLDSSTLQWIRYIGISSRKPCRSSENISTSVSLRLVFGALTWIILIFNGLPWMKRYHSVIFVIIPKHCISDSFLFVYLYIYIFFIVVGFVIHWNESAMDLYVFPILNPLTPPAPPDPSRSSQWTRSECLSHASNLGRWSVST